jgi:hypothetical protein
MTVLQEAIHDARPRMTHDASGLSAVTFAGAFIARRAVLRELMLQPHGQKNIWITTACGEKLPIHQIGSLFGRE